MAASIVLAFVLVVAPLSYFYGADSRLLGDRGWFPDRR
jgi:hypothetical protein